MQDDNEASQNQHPFDLSKDLKQELPFVDEQTRQTEFDITKMP